MEGLKAKWYYFNLNCIKNNSLCFEGLQIKLLENLPAAKPKK